MPWDDQVSTPAARQLQPTCLASIPEPEVPAGAIKPWQSTLSNDNGDMTKWEYAELHWDSSRNGVTWYRQDGEPQGGSEYGLEALQLASEDGWEVDGYGSTPRGESKCLLKRSLE